MSATIVIKAPSFSNLTADLFNILSDNRHMTQVEIQRKKIIFSTPDGFSVTAQTEEALNRFAVMEFLTSPILARFGSESWFMEQSKLFRTKLVINTDGYHLTVNLELSK
jgi:hypothetical protein